jgi:exodeoxyribonuclease-3
MRFEALKDLHEECQPDVICLQETKVKDSEFPTSFFTELGYKYQFFTCDGGQYGVATLSKHKLELVDKLDIVGSGKRHLACFLPDANCTLHNFYIPAGGDIPDENLNPKFNQKLRFLEATAKMFKTLKPSRTIILGDFNIAPLDHDVYDHKKLAKVVSHTAIEIEKLNALLQSGNFIDLGSKSMQDEDTFTWWSYRVSGSFEKNYGRRLDHIWLTKDLYKLNIQLQTLKHFRIKNKPSDHVPIITTLT